MHGTARSRPATDPAGNHVNAVVWIEPGKALVVRGGAGGTISSFEVHIPDATAKTPPALAMIAHSIGPVDRVLIMGSDDLRTALEREIVAIGHHPETIREGSLTGPVDEASLIARLESISAT
jgi:hypothetical protein